MTAWSSKLQHVGDSPAEDRQLLALGEYSRDSSAEDDTYFTDSCYFGFTKIAAESIQQSGRWALSLQQSEEEIWLLEEAKEVGIDAQHFTREQTQLGNGDAAQMGLWPHQAWFNFTEHTDKPSDRPD